MFTANVQRVTPRKAKQWMALNKKNRNLSVYWSKVLQSWMESGRFREIGDTIRFAGEYEVLLDGQHRLDAMIHANKSYRFVVVRGLRVSDFLAMDQGKKRSSADAFMISGIKNYTQCSAVVNFVYAYLDTPGRYTRGGSKRPLSNDNKLLFLSRHPEIQDIVSRSATPAKSLIGLMPMGEYMAAVFLTSQAVPAESYDECLRYWHEFAKGEMLPRDSGRSAARALLVKNSQRTSQRLPRGFPFAALVIGWGKDQEKKKVRHIKFPEEHPPIESLDIGKLKSDFYEKGEQSED